MTRHLAVARLAYRTDSFLPDIAGRSAFDWRVGDAALAGDGESELAAVSGFTADRPDWRPTVLCSAAAAPAGPLDDDVFTAFYDEVIGGLAGRRWDAVYLALDGAVATTRRSRPELGLVAAARAAVGDAPIGASFALHANRAPELARFLSYASVQRTDPAIDRRGTAARVLDRLANAAEGRLSPVGAVVKAQLLVPHFDLREGPMAEVQALARVLESGAVLDVSVAAGSPRTDMPDAGAAGMAFADGDRAAAARVAATIAAALAERRAAFGADADPALAALPYRHVPLDLRPRVA